MEETKNKKNTRQVNYLIIAVIITIIILILSLAGLTYAVYNFDLNRSFLTQAAKYIPYPAAKVNSDYISYYDFIINTKAAAQFYQSQLEEFEQVPSQQELEKIVLEDRLVENVLVKELADQYKVIITQQDIDAELNSIIEKYGSEQQVIDFLNKYYGISLQQYEKYFIKPNLYYDYTNEAITDDESLNQEPKTQIQDALIRLRNGESFEALANEINNEELIQGDGLLGVYQRGEIPKEIEDQIMALEIGEFTDVVTMADSFQIIKLEDRDEETGAMTLKGIIVPIITIEDLLAEKREQAEINIYVY